MRKRSTPLIKCILLIMVLLVSTQVFSQTSLPPGYPDRSPSLDVLPGFVHPPKGYGEVPFYWWQGDTLTRERLEWQLNQLQGKGISSLQINYSHLDQGGISYGLSNPSKPALFTDAWWDLFKWFSTEAQKRGMTVSLSDYTLGIGQGFSMDEAIKENPELNGSVLRKWDKILSGKVEQKLPENLLSLTAFSINADSSLIPESRKNLLPESANGILKYDFGTEKWKVVRVYPERLVPSYDPMNPNSGKAYNKHFFGKFEEALGKNSGKLDFFFSDELNFRVGGNLWNSTFAAEFKKRKGYDVVPYLDALFYPIGSMTPKIRLDFNDVLVSLSEENFFKPVFDWHEERGMIFGCDHGGRGREVAEFGDYFRTQRWNQGPGSDQPNLGKDIIKAKVASSISHLYQRPRVWLEGFYGSGWGTNSSDVTDAIFANFVAGYNLLSFHGLYYSTQGGWWEWAPPDNHFRMPYWQQIDPLMNCIQRLSYLMSQGVHQCDVAILYPVEPVVAGMDGNRSVSTAFEAGEKLYDQGIDFDFIDFESLGRSKHADKEIQVSGEKYKVLVIPSMKAIRYASLQKIQEFVNDGGIVVNIGDRPEATEKNGSNDPELLKLTNNIFSERKNLIQVA
ncbi:MAG: glycosyl hydrolase, partial [Bacteroidia bacterium]